MQKEDTNLVRGVRKAATEGGDVVGVELFAARVVEGVVGELKRELSSDIYS